MKVADQISDSGLCSLLTGTASRFFYYDELESSATLKLYTDAAPSVGFGGYLMVSGLLVHGQMKCYLYLLIPRQLLCGVVPYRDSLYFVG